MKVFSAHNVQSKVQQIHWINIKPKLPTMSKITSIDLKNRILLHFLQLLHEPKNLVSLHIFNNWPLIHQVLVPWQKRKFFHMLVWQSRPSCSNYMSRFGEVALWCSTTWGDAKVFPGGLCHDRVPEGRLGPILEGGRFGGGSSSV